jgi:hypothetical protein
LICVEFARQRGELCSSGHHALNQLLGGCQGPPKESQSGSGKLSQGYSSFRV